MLFALTDEQQELGSTVRSLLAKRSESAAVRSALGEPKGYDESLWSVLCSQVGVAALAIPEEYGGAGFSLFETHVVLEELGAALTPSPLLGSGVLAAQALLLSGSADACTELLPGIAEGTTVASLVWAGDDGEWSTESAAVKATQAGGGVALGGRGRFVLDGDAADVLLVLAEAAAGIGLYRVDMSNVECTSEVGMDQTLRFATVTFDGTPAQTVAQDALPFLPTLRDIACVAVTALQVGALQRCLDMTVAYSKDRVQFGRPIGSFQALKHRMADMLVDVETARSASWAAAWSAAQSTGQSTGQSPDPDLPERAAMAKAWCSDALNRVAGEAVQMHGGIAITWEHDVQMYFKRAHALSQLFGQPHQHRRRLAALWL
jgi:alkylation response protein AidB-like acyl-CoA dehydrogenase